MKFSSALEIETINRDALDKLFDKDDATEGDTISSDDGRISLTLEKRSPSKGFGLGEAVSLTIQIVQDQATPLAVSVAAAWIYGKLTGKARQAELEKITYRIVKNEMEDLVRKLQELNNKDNFDKKVGNDEKVVKEANNPPANT